jgi:hypothetical protein
MRNVVPAVLIAVSFLAVAACRGGGAPKPSPPPVAPAHHPAVTASQVPSARPPGALGATPSATALPGRTPAALLPFPAQKVQRLPPNAAPRIIDVAVSETTVQPGDRVFGRVLTSSNVASVQARIGSYAVSLEKVGVGRFELTYTVGPLPFFVRGNFTMQVVARNTRGDTATRVVPLTVR